MMDRDVLELSEKEVQTFIADYPWLLNFDYEKIPEFIWYYFLSAANFFFKSAILLFSSS